MKKKLFSALLCVAMVASLLAGCGKKTEAPVADAPATETEAPAADATTYKVGVAIYQFDDNFMTLYRNEIESYFKTLEDDTTKYEVTIVDGKNDMATQSEHP